MGQCLYLRMILLVIYSYLFNKGSKDRTFQQEHHYGLREEEDSRYITNKFLNEWEKVKDERFPILKTQYKAFKSMIWISFCLALLETLFSFSGPLLVSRIVKYIQNQDQEYDFSYGIVLVVLFVLSRVGTILASSQNGQYLVNKAENIIINDF